MTFKLYKRIGGSPVQSDNILNSIKNFTKIHKIPLYSFAEDQALSGGYYILIGGNRVYIDKSSLVGSIGVISSEFIFKKLIDKLKIERRSLASTKNLL